MPIEGGPGLPGEAVRSARWPSSALPAAIVLDGRVLRLRSPGTAALLRALAQQDWSAFLPGLLRARDRRWLFARMWDNDDPLDYMELSAAAQWTGAYVCGMHWWAACRLASIARNGWHSIDGAVSLHGGDLLALPVDRALHTVWALLAERRSGDREAMELLEATVFDSGPEELELANAVAPGALDALEARWAAEAASGFAGFGGMDGVWNPLAGQPGQ